MTPVNLSWAKSFLPHSATLNEIMVWVTSLGDWRFVAILVILVSLFFWFYKKRAFIPPLWITVAGTEITVEIVKTLVHRSRPFGADFLDGGFSFPSGHSAIAVALYGFLGYCFYQFTKKHGRKMFTLPLSGLLILAIGFSRIYLGVHFPSDVLGGYFVGFLWLVGTIHFMPGKNLFKNPKK